MEALVGLIFLLFWLGIIFFMGFMWWKIVKKTGYHGALGILMLVPIANIIMMAILAFRDWPIHKELKEGEIRPSSSLPAPLIVVIAIVTIIPILALLAAIAIPNLLRARLTANEAQASASVKTIATAFETYAAINNGRYPSDEFVLTNSQPPYLTKSYHGNTISGYRYTLRPAFNGYKIIAEPSSCGTTGNEIFIMETGGIEYKKQCSK